MTKALRSILLLIATFVGTNAQLTRQECTNQGGVVVGDIGNGAIFQPSFTCESNGLPPIDTVIASPGEPIATDGEVCCGTITADQCLAMGGEVAEFVCPGAETPLGTVSTISMTARQVSATTSLCCPNELGDFPPAPVDRDQLTRQECVDSNGLVVGDIGNGAIFAADYICDSNGLAPIANIIQPGPESGEPVAVEGEVCCGPAGQQQEIPTDGDTEREEVTRQECTDELNGEIVGDIGDGAIHREDYVCESSGESPLATVVPLEGEPVAREGEVCCSTAPAASTTGTTEPPSDEMPGDGTVCLSSMVTVAVSALLWVVVM
ncbi:MAG: hypothetical protein SGILL_006520 [Bacillariaceae sp.]